MINYHFHRLLHLQVNHHVIDYQQLLSMQIILHYRPVCCKQDKPFHTEHPVVKVKVNKRKHTCIELLQQAFS